jgi:hypothetical protein
MNLRRKVAGLVLALLLVSPLATRADIMDGPPTASGLVRGLLGWGNVRNGQTGTYTAQSSDCGKTISLGGSALYTLTVNAASGYSTQCILTINNADTGRAKTMAINGQASNFFLWPQQTIQLYNSGGTWQISGRARWVLNVATTFYFDPANGSATADCLATGNGACASLQQLWMMARDNLDLQNDGTVYTTFQGAASQTYSQGFYTEEPLLNQHNPAHLIIDFGGSTIQPSSGTYAIFSSYGTRGYTLQNFTCSGTAGTGCIGVDGGQVLVGSGVTFGNVGTSGPHVLVYGGAGGGQIVFQQNYAISGGATYHVYVNGQGYAQVNNVTITCSGTPAFSQAFVYSVAGGNVFFDNSGTLATFSGCSGVTGTRFIAATLGTINAAVATSLTYFPGNANGTISSGAVYGGGQAIQQIIPFSSYGVLAQNATYYFLTAQAGAEASAQGISPKTGTFRNLYAQASPAPASGQTVVLTLRIANASTALTCTITGPATTCNDTTHAVTIAVGNSYEMQAVLSATTGSVAVAAGVEFDNP